MKKYYAKFTTIGLAKLANAQLTQDKIEITEMAFGDANGAPYRPTGQETEIVNEVWRTSAHAELSKENPNWFEVVAVIPAATGGFTVCEFGVFDEDGDMVAIGNYPVTEKPSLTDGSVMDLVVRAIVRASNTEITNIELDPTVVSADKGYVNQEIVKISETVDQNVAEINQQLSNTNNKLSRFEKIQLQGTSFVDELLSLIKVRSMYVKNNVTSNGIDIGVRLDDELNSVIEYNFKYNADSLLLLRGTKTGFIDTELVSITPTENGTFITATSTNTKYTTTVNDSISFTFTGTDLKFRAPTESRGGLWEFKLNNGLIKQVTCYSENSVLKTVEHEVFKNLDYAAHTCVATFLGDDPNNPPSAIPSRGYFYIPSTDWTLRAENKQGYMDELTSRNLISPNTIPDFAIAARPNNTAHAHAWVPAHASVSGVSLNPQIKVIIDGIDKVTVSGNLLVNNLRNVKALEILQSFNAVNPSASEIVLWKHYIQHTITIKQPCCEIKNRLEVLRDTNVASTYLAMTGVDSTQVSRLVLNNGTEYSSIPNDGSEVQVDYDVSSAMYAGEYVSGRSHATAIDVNSYVEAVGLKRRPENDKSLPGLLTFRIDNIAKFYLRATPNSSILRAGEVLRNTQRLVCITGVKYPNTLLKII